MTRKKRSTLSRSPILRAQMWISKVDADTYSKQLNATKPLRIASITEYQSTHEQLISLVKKVLEPMGLAHLTHEYMWYAQELYKASKTYSSNALQHKANTIYAKYLSKKLNPTALEKIASFFGIKPDPPEKIFQIQPSRVSRIIIGFGESGYIISSGNLSQHQPYSSAQGSSIGMVLPYPGNASHLKVYVYSNTLNDVTYVQCRRNEGEEVIELSIPSGETGLFSNDTDVLRFNENDRIDFLVDTTASSEGSIDIPSITILYEFM